MTGEFWKEPFKDWMIFIAIMMVPLSIFYLIFTCGLKDAVITDGEVLNETKLFTSKMALSERYSIEFERLGIKGSDELGALIGALCRLEDRVYVLEQTAVRKVDCHCFTILDNPT